MSNTEKILEEFEKLRIISVTVSDSDVDNDTYIHDESPEYIKAFISASIQQARAEERDKVRGEIEKYIPNGSILDISGIKKDIIDRLSLLDDTKTNG